MSQEYKLSFTGKEVDDKLVKIDTLPTKDYVHDAIHTMLVPGVDEMIKNHSQSNSAHNDIRTLIDAAGDSLDSHIDDKNNPHGVTVKQIGASPSDHKHAASDVGALAEKAEVCDDCDTEIKVGGAKTTLKRITADTLNSPNKAGLTSYAQGIVLTYAYSGAYGIQYAFLGGQMFERTYSNSAMLEWKKVATSADIDALTAADVGAATEEHAHDGRYYTETEIDTKISTLQTQLDGKSDTSHTHNYAGSSSAGGAATSANKVNKSLTVKLNSGTTEGTNMFTFNGSDAKSVNITPSAIGAASSSHNHDDRYYTETEIDTKLNNKSDTSHNHDSSYDKKGSADSALASAKTYTDSVKNELLNGAGSAYDTLKELGDLITDNQDAIDALETVASGKQDKITGAATTITGSNLTASRALISNSSGKVAVSAVTSTELGYLDGATSNIQTQLDGKAPSGFGLGTTAKSISNTDLLDTLATGKSGWYRGNNVTNAPSTSWYYFQVIADSTTFAYVLAYKYDGRIYKAFWDSGNFYGWAELYDEDNKPTPAEIGALAEKAEVCADCDSEIKVGGAKTTLKRITADTLNSPNKAGLTTYSQGIVLTYAYSTAHGIQYAFLGGQMFERTYSNTNVGEWKKLATTDYALNKSGDKMTGNLEVEKATPIVKLKDTANNADVAVYAANHRAYLQAQNVTGDDKNRRYLQLIDSNGVADVDGAALLVDVVDGTATSYRIYHQGNKPTAADVGAANPNLLHNWYFANPVNQRGQAEYNVVSTTTYFIDRWTMRNGGATLTLEEDGLRITNTSAGGYATYVEQRTSDVDISNGVCLSAAVSEVSGTVYIQPAYTDGTYGSSGNGAAVGLFKRTYKDDKKINRIIIQINAGASIKIKAIKLELGSDQTLAHQDENNNWVLNEIPDYSAELLRCIQSTVDSGDTYANKVIYHTGNKPTASDVEAAPTDHASSETTYGIGTSSNYGHVKLSDSTSSTSAASAGVAASPKAVKAAYDLANTAKTNADGSISGLSVSGKVITYTKNDGTTGTITTQDTNTTYSNMTAATASAAGKAGLVPAPAAGKQTSFLRGDGTWVVPTNTTYSAGTGISLSGTTFSNSGVRSIASGSTNGTISVNTNGTSTDVAVKGLGSAAYTASTAYAAASHGTHVTYSTTTPKAAGTAAVGSATTVSRSDHVHPAQTTVSGNAGSATKLETARTIRTNLGSTSTASFNGTANVTPGVTGTLGIANGGTGATTAADALKNLGITSGTSDLTAGTSELATGAIYLVYE